jgi:hypothetical protein
MRFLVFVYQNAVVSFWAQQVHAQVPPAAVAVMVAMTQPDGD